MEMTNEQRARVFAMYPNAKAIGAYNNGATVEGNIREIHFEKGEINIDGFPRLAKSCKLILKPLSEISEQDAVEVAKIMYESETLHTSKEGKEWVTAYENDTVSLGTASNWTKAINHLRARSYDCDSLIPQNLAIPS